MFMPFVSLAVLMKNLIEGDACAARKEGNVSSKHSMLLIA